jgi:RNA-directed DNA polymerase
LGPARSKRQQGYPAKVGISSLLANIFLHYILNLWADQWRRRRARLAIVRYANDFVMAREQIGYTQEMLLALRTRSASV